VNQMTEALQKAGVQLPPLKERVWNMLKEHPTATAMDIAHYLGIRKEDKAAHSVITALSYMETIGLVASQKFKRTVGKSKRMVKHYTASTEYISTGVAKPVMKVAFKPEVPVVMPKSTFEEMSPMQIYVDALTVAKARELYNHLHKMFGSK